MVYRDQSNDMLNSDSEFSEYSGDEYFVVYIDIDLDESIDYEEDIGIMDEFESMSRFCLGRKFSSSVTIVPVSSIAYKHTPFSIVGTDILYLPCLKIWLSTWVPSYSRASS